LFHFAGSGVLFQNRYRACARRVGQVDCSGCDLSNQHGRGSGAVQRPRPQLVDVRRRAGPRADSYRHGRDHRSPSAERLTYLASVAAMTQHSRGADERRSLVPERGKPKYVDSRKVYEPCASAGPPAGPEKVGLLDGIRSSRIPATANTGFLRRTGNKPRRRLITHACASRTSLPARQPLPVAVAATANQMSTVLVGVSGGARAAWPNR
jgi:hypothetical protein